MKNTHALGLTGITLITGFVIGSLYAPISLNHFPVSWHQYGHNAHRHTVFRADSADRPQSWTYTVDRAGIASPAAVVDGVAYAGSNGHNVAAVRDGHPVWQVSVPNQVMTTPLIGHHLVIVGVGNKAFSSQHVRGTGWSGVIALNQSTGRAVWKVKTIGEAMPTPVLYRNRVYAATGAGHIDVINWARGMLVNRISLGGSYVSMSSPLMVGNDLYVGGALPYVLYAVSLTNDHILWRLPLPADGGLDDCSPAWADGYVTAQYTNYLNAKGTKMRAVMMATNIDGHLVWRTPLGEGKTALDEMQTGQPTVVDGIIYVGSPVTDRVYAINGRTGHILWRTNLGAGVRGNPALVGRELLVGDSMGRLDTLSVGTGRILRQVQLTGATAASSPGTPTPTGFSGSGPVIQGQTLFIVSMNGQIMARPLQEFLIKR